MKITASTLMGALGASAMHEWDAHTIAKATGGCIAPGKCSPPQTNYSKVDSRSGPTPGIQWNIDGGFCGSWSTQQNALSVGAYISQDLVRKANKNSNGEHYMHGNRNDGYEVMPSNVAYTLENLRLRFDEFDYMQPSPQAPAFKKWAKRHLAQGAPIVFFPMCKGDGHMPYKDSCPNGGHVDHVESMYGLFSNHDLNDETVYDDDWIVHTSDQDAQPYYRRLNFLDDTPDMQGNCRDAQPGFGRNEMFPCIDSHVTYGTAILGLDLDGTLPVSLIIDQYREPNVRRGEKATPLAAEIVIRGFDKTVSHDLYRFNSTAALPTSTAELKNYDPIFTFFSQRSETVFSDPEPFMSNTAVYYVAV